MDPTEPANSDVEAGKSAKESFTARGSWQMAEPTSGTSSQVSTMDYAQEADPDTWVVINPEQAFGSGTLNRTEQLEIQVRRIAAAQKVDPDSPEIRAGLEALATASCSVAQVATAGALERRRPRMP